MKAVRHFRVNVVAASGRIAACCGWAELIGEAAHSTDATDFIAECPERQTQRFKDDAHET